MLQTPATLQMIQDIKQGLIPVGKAVEADNATNAANDGNGDNIANTYAKQNGSYPGMSVGTAVSAADATHATDADNDGDGNNIASTYAKGTMVPVRSAYGPYFTVVGSLPFKAGDIAIVIDNSNNTNYEIGGLYKITGESGGTGGGLAILQDTSIGNIFDSILKEVKVYSTFDYDDNPAEIYGGTWERLGEQCLLESQFYIDFTGKTFTINLNDAFNTVNSCALISITCMSSGEKARGIWAYTPNAGNNYQGKQLTSISVTNGYNGDTLSVNVANGSMNNLSVTTSYSGTWRITVIPLRAQSISEPLYIWRRL